MISKLMDGASKLYLFLHSARLRLEEINSMKNLSKLSQKKTGKLPHSNFTKSPTQPTTSNITITKLKVAED